MKRLKAEGEEWEATIEQDADGDGSANVVFHCVSNSQRPYRVAELPSGETREAESWAERDLMDLFATSQTMDYTRDPDSHPDTHGMAERGNL